MKEENILTKEINAMKVMPKEEVRNKAGQFIKGHKGLRPLKFKSPEELRLKIEEYWKTTIEKKEPITLGGLAVALDVDRATLLNYSLREPYYKIIKRARAICEEYLEKYLLTGKNVVGSIFILKNGYGWTDGKSIEIKTKDKPDTVLLDI